MWILKSCIVKIGRSLVNPVSKWICIAHSRKTSNALDVSVNGEKIQFQKFTEAVSANARIS